jgi:site-specific DNA-methyltransferase (adenine-specific)
MKGINVICGNNIEVLKTLADNSVDSVVTDPPYGLGKEPDANEMLKAWLESGYMEVSGKGFMGKEWDSFVPQPVFWKEVFRVIKPGGHILSFFGTRTYDWGVMAIRLAGFEIRDSLQWVYGSGFPKSHNISKAVDKMYGAEREVVGIGNAGKGFNKVKGFGVNTTQSDEFTSEWDVTTPSTEQAKEWDGWGSALKPAVEPIVLARKPLEKGLSIADNVLKWGTGAINIDGCRVVTNDNLNGGAYAKDGTDREKMWGEEANNSWRRDKGLEFENPIGRFPANLILTHHPDCECKGLKKVKPSNGSGKASEKGGGFSKGMFGDGTPDNIGGGFTDENGEETIEDWNCVDDCPIKIMDEQSGESKSVASIRNNKKRNDENIYGGGKGIPQVSLESNYSDKGGASRFFYTPKTSKSERNWGLEDFEETISSDRKAIHNVGANNPRNRSGKPKANIHPTVKPVKLMQYLARLITPPNGLVLDPFNGSGTTGIACKLEGFDYIGLEISEEYCEIARSRIESWDDELEYMMELRIKEIEREQKKDVSQLNLF